MARKPTAPGVTPRHVSIVALPDATVSTLFGIYDVLTFFARRNPAAAASAPFRVEIRWPWRAASPSTSNAPSTPSTPATS
jgi:hypothetical protein